MIIAVCFVCQKSSASAEMNSYTNSLTLKTQSNPDLNEKELLSCIAQNGQTGLYTVTVGPNIFRSNIIIYNAFSDVEVILTPVDGSTIEDALKFFIASYEITFLDSTLIQQGAVGQLLSTMYNLNECVLNGQILYETFLNIIPKVSTNPNCKVIPTDDVKYEFLLESNKLLTDTIKKADFDFSNLDIKKIDCTVGTDQQKADCAKTSAYISRENFIYSEIKVMIPKTITANNIYIDDYGREQNVSTTSKFILVFNIPINNRKTVEDCTSVNKVAFTEISVFIFQQSNGLCDFVGVPQQEFWITVSELLDNSGRKFQLQFYTDQPFSINQYIDCQTWEISEYESKEQCQVGLQNISTFSPNFTSSISYKLYNQDNNYNGSFRFSADNLPSGNAEVGLYIKSLCVHILNNLTSTKTFADIDLRLSSSFQKYQANEFDFEISKTFDFPSTNETYCFNLDQQEEDLLAEIGFQGVFGIAQVVNSVLLIKELQLFLPYDNFYPGYICLIGMILVMVIWEVATYKCRNKPPKPDKGIQK